MTPFRSEKNTNWEGAFRVPLLVRWPGKIPAGVGLQRDRPAPRLAADVPRGGRRAGHRREAEGRATRPATRPSRCTSTATTCCRTSPARRTKSPRKGFIYFSDDGDCVALRFDNWKVVFMEQRARGRCRSGRSRSCRCACRSSSTCGPTRSSGPTSRRTRTGTGTSTEGVPDPRRRTSSWGSSSRRSRSSRRARRRRASRSTRRWRRWRTPRAARRD